MSITLIKSAKNNLVKIFSSPTWVQLSINELKVLLGLKSAAYTESSSYADSAHTHDDRYYTESEITNLLSGKSNTAHTRTQEQVTPLTFHVATFENPLNLDGTTNKDFICTIEGSTTVNLTNVVDGDAGMIKLIIDNVGGYTVTLGTMFTEKITTDSIVTTANIKNYISYRKVGTDIVYTIAKVEV